ncbi:hypothetical protein BaRGS_00000783, partial [Batillaria attramentaria]
MWSHWQEISQRFGENVDKETVIRVKSETLIASCKPTGKRMGVMQEQCNPARVRSCSEVALGHDSVRADAWK